LSWPSLSAAAQTLTIIPICTALALAPVSIQKGLITAKVVWSISTSGRAGSHIHSPPARQQSSLAPPNQISTQATWFLYPHVHTLPVLHGPQSPSQFHHDWAIAHPTNVQPACSTWNVDEQESPVSPMPPPRIHQHPYKLERE
jgi:hypothetical protein